MSVADVLIAARKKIERPENWTKGTYSRNEQGACISSRDSHAVCWCSIGATWAVGDDGEAYVALLQAIPAERAALLEGNKVAAFNDAESTTHADVLALFDRAIQLAKEQTP